MAVYEPQISSDPHLLESTAEEYEAGCRSVVVRAYALMFGGLLISALVAYLATSLLAETSPAEFRWKFDLLFAFQVIAAGAFSRYVPRLSLAMAAVVFVVYAAFNGVSFCILLLFVPPDALAYAFVASALTFGIAAAYGHYTDRDLSSARGIIVMLVFGMGVVIVLNALTDGGTAYLASSYLGVIAFACLASSHAQNIAGMHGEFDDDASGWKAAVCGALLIYVDLVNIYILILRSLRRVGRDED